MYGLLYGMHKALREDILSSHFGGGHRLKAFAEVIY